MDQPSVPRDTEALVARIRPVLEEHGVQRASLYGSMAKGTANEGSDVDLLVELPEDRSLLDLVALQRDLEAALDRPVDVAEYETLHPLIRDQVLGEQVAVV